MGARPSARSRSCKSSSTLFPLTCRGPHTHTCTFQGQVQTLAHKHTLKLTRTHSRNRNHTQCVCTRARFQGHEHTEGAHHMHTTQQQAADRIRLVVLRRRGGHVLIHNGVNFVILLLHTRAGGRAQAAPTVPPALSTGGQPIPCPCVRWHRGRRGEVWRHVGGHPWWLLRLAAHRPCGGLGREGASGVLEGFGGHGGSWL